MSHAQRMFTSCLAAALLIVGLAARCNAQGRDSRAPGVRGVLKSIDTASNTITLSVGRDAASDKSYTLATDVEVATGSYSRSGVLQEARVADLSVGTSVLLSLTADDKVSSILAEEPTVRGVVQQIDAAKKTLTLTTTAFGREREQAPEAKSYTVDDAAEIGIDDGRGRRFSIREGQLTELTPGAVVTAWLSLDRQRVRALTAEGPTHVGTIKAWDPATRTVTLAMNFGSRNAEGEKTLTWTLADFAPLIADDGKGRTFSVKAAKPADVLVGQVGSVRLSVDQTKATHLRVTGPTVFGLLKSVDPAKRTIVIAMPAASREDTPEEKTFTVAPDARILIDDANAELAALQPTESRPNLLIRLSLDQTTVQSIVSQQARGR